MSVFFKKVILSWYIKTNISRNLVFIFLYNTLFSYMFISKKDTKC